MHYRSAVHSVGFKRFLKKSPVWNNIFSFTLLLIEWLYISLRYVQGYFSPDLTLTREIALHISVKKTKKQKNILC